MIDLSKRFILFAGDVYYPVGGAYDIEASADSMEELRLLWDQQEYQWSHVLDTQNHVITSLSGEILHDRFIKRP